uniref:Late embryogenesis abundant protein LEA-2 subgroup domain-containing protein n=1 Tax=Oryza meridionalis TaxID=40149 RepID=A0A0E0BZL6_9ORYZ
MQPPPRTRDPAIAIAGDGAARRGPPPMQPPGPPPVRHGPPPVQPTRPVRQQHGYYYEEEQRPLHLHVRPARSSSSALASCLVAAAFLALAVGGAGAALFVLFRPRPPDIAVAAVRLPAFASGPNGTVAFTFEQTAAVRNPNRAPLAHFDSSLRVAYAGGELGSVYIPAGLIDGGRTKDMSASFAVPAFAAATPPPLPQEQMTAAAAAAASAQQQQPPAAAAVMEVDSLLVVKGRVTVLRVLTHHVEAAKVCRVGVSPVDGKVLGFRC